MNTAQFLRREVLAAAAHQANYAYCQAIGDKATLWSQTSEGLKESVREGVTHALAGMTPEMLHISWMKKKIEQGWVCGLLKDETKKTHPCLVPYSDLPEAQKKKDYIFQTTILELSKVMPIY